MADLFGLGLPPTPGSIAPSGTYGAPAAGGGILDTITKIAANPLLQAAMSGYLGYAGSPRRGGRGLAMENAGMNALGAFNQAEQQQTQLPLQQQQLRQSQLQTQALERQLRPMPPELLAKIDVLKSNATDEHERAAIDSLEAQAQAGYLTPAELDANLEHFDESKRLMEMAKAQSAMSSPQMMQWFFQAQQAMQQGRPIPPMPTAGAIPGMGAGMGVSSGAGTPTAPSPDAGGPPPVAARDALAVPKGLGFTPKFHVSMSDGSTAYNNGSDDKWWVEKSPGVWGPVGVP